ncbi:hypothetical protein AB0J21_15730 [Streptomyces sp. NPDC049954]|uniref:hypothetical protein n=1 Tax=Streptomyces sp. NPDC049954 TaxID=3155779 RepID=UPI00343AEFE0
MLTSRPPHAGVERRPATAVDLEQRIASFTGPFGKDTGYTGPTRSERETVAAGLGLLLDGKREAARTTLATTGYVLRVLTDRYSGRRYAELAERLPTGRRARGWGRVYVDLDRSARWSVQVPHPVADLRTERIGVAVLRETPGGVLVLAGAHRAAGEGREADVAHREDTVFQAVCALLTRRGIPGVQLHGFADASSPGDDVVLSPGRGEDGLAQARRLSGALAGRGFEVCRAWTVPRCPLAGRTNVQGRYAAEAGVPFLHVELSHRLRTDPGLSAALVATLTTTVTSAPPREDAHAHPAGAAHVRREAHA